MFRKIKIGTPFLLGAMAVEPEPQKAPTNEPSPYVCRPSDLPLYTPLHVLNKPKQTPHPPTDSKIHSSIEKGIRAVRTEVTKGYKVVAAQKKNVEDFVHTGIAHSQSTIDYLNQPDNTMPRVGAIAIGGAAGLVLAVRGGFIRKIIYTGIGAGGIASLCYPKEAENFAQQGLVETRKGVAVAYNFIKGVKPGDRESTELFTGFPTSLHELKELFADLGNSVKDSIYTSKK